MKPERDGKIRYFYVSHPTWVRGLKHIRFKFNTRQDNVAPYVGAWIETALYW